MEFYNQVSQRLYNYCDMRCLNAYTTIVCDIFNLTQFYFSFLNGADACLVPFFPAGKI